MGLTIHYDLHSTTRSPSKAKKLIEQLRQRALDLPFQEVGELVELSGNGCDFENYDQHDPLRWLLIQATRPVFWKGFHFRGTPSRLFAFSTWPGEGCEQANFGLAVYRKVIEVEDDSTSPPQTKRLRTGLKDWSWSSFCKTQYASNPECGGVANFFRCHLSVIKMLDHAKAVGILESVKDEGDFWEKRNLEALVREVGEWNVAMAGLAGQMKDLFGDDQITAEITDYPDFEHLEAEGRKDEEE